MICEQPRQANAQTRRQIERGDFDIETVNEANRTLIAAIEDSLHIADEGREARARSNAELNEMEQQLHRSLAAGNACEQAGTS